MNKPLLALASLLLVGFANARASGLDWLSTATGGFIALPPVPITDGAVSKVSWSPDGEYVLIVERPNALTQEQALLTGAGEAPGPIHVIAWDHQFQRTRQLWSTEDSSQTVEDISWVHGSSSAYITFRWMVQENPNAPTHAVYGVVWMDANSGKYLWVPGMERLVTRPRISPSPSRPLVAAGFSDNPADDEPSSGRINANVTDSGENKGRISFTVSIIATEFQKIEAGTALSLGLSPAKANNYWTLDGSGSVRSSIRLDHSLDLPLVWNQDGSAWFLRSQDETTKKVGLYRLTPQGKLEATDEVESTTIQRTPSLMTQSKPESAEMGKSKVSFESLWLKSVTESERNEFNLTPNGSWPELSPTDGAVFYIDGGVAKVRLLIPLSKNQLKAIQTAQKERESAQGQPGLLLTGINELRFYLGPTQGTSKVIP